MEPMVRITNNRRLALTRTYDHVDRRNERRWNARRGLSWNDSDMMAKDLTKRITIAIHMAVGHGGAGMEFMFVHLIVMLSGYIIPNWMYYIDYVEGKNP